MNPDEKAPLLHRKSRQYSTVESYDMETGMRKEKLMTGFCGKLFPTGYWSEFKTTMNLSWALMVTGICASGMQPVATIFGGHLGKIELDAVALSNTIINVFGFSIVSGLVTACDTLFSQTFGSMNKKLLGVHFQRSLIIIMLALFPCYAFFLNIEGLLLLIQQDPEVARLCSQYLIYFIPGMFFLFLYTVLQRYVQCQNIVIPHIIIGAIGIGVHILFQYLMLFQFGLGIPGSAIAQDIAFFSLCLLTLIYIFASKMYKDTWGGWDIRCMTEWGSFMKLAIPGMLMMCLEWWAFEACLLLAGTQGTTALAGQSVTFNIDTFFYSIPNGMSTATAIRVGQLLGAARPIKAKTSSRVGYTIVVTWSLAAAILLVALRYQFPRIFTTEEDVIALVAIILPLMAAYQFFDNIATIGRGVLRGSGKQKVGAVIIFIGFYIIALPMGIALMLETYLSIIGLWIGLSVALFITSIIYTVYTQCLADWNMLAFQARIRSHARRRNTTTVGQGWFEERPSIVQANAPPLIQSENEEEMNASTDKDMDLSGSLHAPPSTVEESLGISSENVVFFTVYRHNVTTRVILKRLGIIGICVLILVIGIMCRAFIPIPDYRDSEMVLNSTTVDLVLDYLNSTGVLLPVV